MTRKLMVTGYGGFVAGSTVWQALRDGGWDVYALSLIEAPEERENFHCLQFDLCDTVKLKEVFGTVKPDAVVHTAALADIDYCQNNQADAERINVGVTRALAGLCARHGHETDRLLDPIRCLTARRACTRRRTSRPR